MNKEKKLVEQAAEVGVASTLRTLPYFGLPDCPKLQS